MQVTTAGTSGQVLTSNGAGIDPTFQALPASGGWTDDGTVVRLTTASDSVSIGAATGIGNKLSVFGSGVVENLVHFGSTGIGTDDAFSVSIEVN